MPTQIDTSRLPAALQLKTELRATGSLKPLGRQARIHTAKQVDQIVASFVQFGILSPLLIDDAGHILVGVGRWLAAKKLGLHEIPVIVVSHLSEVEKRAYVIADNQLGALSGWDADILGIELAELRSLEPGFNLEITGFTLAKLDALEFGYRHANDDEADLPPLRAAPVNRLGDLWIAGGHRIACADTLKPESWTALMQGEQARTACHDLPYNCPIADFVTKGTRHDEFVMASGEMSPEEFDRFLLTALEITLAHLVPGGLLYAWMDWRNIEALLRAGADAGADLINLAVWTKPVAGQGSFLRSQHEMCPIFRKPGAGHLNRVELGRHGRSRSNVWAYDGVNGFGLAKAQARERHPTSKNVACIRDLILDSTGRGDIVVDGFSGSGTTLIAAEQVDRRARVMDLSERYVDVTIERWQAATGREATHAVTGRTFFQTAEDRRQPPAQLLLPPPSVRIRRRLPQA
jgi:DNA modification methylase